MKRIFILMSFTLVALSLKLYGMEAEAPREAELQRLFIRNERTDAVDIVYTYESGPLKDANFVRTVYPEETIWINNPNLLSKLELDPHGAVWGFTSPRAITSRINQAIGIKASLPQRRGAVEMVISGLALAPYKTTFKSLPTAAIEPALPIERCTWLGDVFRRARQFFEQDGPIKAEYILGVPPAPGSRAAQRERRDYDTSLDQAQKDLVAGWQEVKIAPAGLNKQAIINLIGLAYAALRFGKEKEVEFRKAVREAFTQSREAAIKAACHPQ